MLAALFLAFWPIASSLLPFASAGHLYERVHSAKRFHDVHKRGCRSETVRKEVVLTWTTASPDGYSRNVIFINGQSPGPLLELCEGDDVEFKVRNKTPFNQTVHFHGLEQFRTPWSDGVPGLSQYPIPPGEEFLYKWTARQQYGTYWYHAHYGSHVQDGLYGPILIHRSLKSAQPFNQISGRRPDVDAMLSAENDPKLVLVTDWSHYTDAEFYTIEEEVNLDNFCLDSVLINGKGSTTCLPQAQIDSLTPPTLKPLLGNTTLTAKGCIPATNQGSQGNFTHDYSKLPPEAFDVCTPSKGPQEVFKVDARDRWASFNFIGAASINLFTISIDEHSMWVYAADGRFIEPVKVDALTIGNGQRYNVMVKLDKRPADYTIRFSNPGFNQILNGYATLSYKHGHGGYKSKPSIGLTATNTTAGVVFLADDKIKPYPPVKLSQTVDKTFHMSINHFGASWRWTLSGGEDYRAELDDDTPLLFEPFTSNGLDPNITITTDYGDWVDLIIQVDFPPLERQHPLHKHGNKAWVIGYGDGEFNYSSVADAVGKIPQNFNLVDPPYRDGYLTPLAVQGASWLALRYYVDNPGAWLFHCHIQSHLRGGMAISILDGIDRYPKVPKMYREGNGIECNDDDNDRKHKKGT